MRIRRHKRTLTNGEEKTYLYAESKDGTQRQSLAIDPTAPLGVGSGAQLYRGAEKRRIVAALQANSSLLVVGEAGIGKTTLGNAVAEELQLLGFNVAIARPMTVKQTLMDIALQLEVETESLEGKGLTTAELCVAIADYVHTETAFLIFDDAHRYPVQLRTWLTDLHHEGQPILLLATHPPARDIFLKLPRIELKPMNDRAIREIMKATAVGLGLELSTSQLAALQQRCGGNPMLAGRVVTEEHLGLENTSPDHTQWIDGTPFLIAALMVLLIARFIGLGLNSTSLYLIGGIMTVAVGIVRIMVFSIPRKSNKLGQ